MPTQKKQDKILAIDPGTRYWGVAVFRGEELREGAVRVLKENGSPAARLKEVREVFGALLEDHAPDVIVLEKPFFFWSRQAHFLDTLIEELKVQAGREKVVFREYSPRTVRKIVCANGNTTKREMAKFLTLLYPELRMRLRQDRKYKERYWGHMFDAVGLGTCYLKDTETRIALLR